MNLEKEIKEEYVKRCAYYCNHGGYSRLESEKRELIAEFLKKYGINGNKNKVLQILTFCEQTVFDYLEELSGQKIRCYMWINELHEKELKIRLNTSLQLT
jgi:hypothetical protein